MARPSGGKEVLLSAKECLKKAKTADELRKAQAVVLPLEFNLTLSNTAKIIGKSIRRTSQMRSEFIRHAGLSPADKSSWGGRRRENMPLEEEIAFLVPFLEKAKSGGILIVSDIQRELEKRLGRKVATASVYNLLHRHGWRKLVPDKRNPKTDVETQEEWKKNSLK